MGIIDKIFGKRASPAQAANQTFQLLEGYTHSFRTWQGSIYESDLIRAALDAHGRHAAKLMPHLEGSAKPNLRSRLEIQPNEFQTWPQFLYRLAVTLYARNTAFIVPVIGEYGEPNGIFGIVPERWELVEYKKTPYIRFYLAQNQRVAVELWKVGILTRYQYKNELFGESNDALKSTLDLIAMQKQGIEQGVKNAASYRFMATANNWNSDEDLAKERERFDNFNFRNGGGGVLLFPNTYKDVKQINQDAYKADAEQLKYIKENVFDYFAINEDVIQNRAYGDAWLAYYEGAVEWLAINLSETITKMLFSERERQFGNRIFFTSNRLQYMSNADKLNAIQTFADRGLMTRNELREIVNLAPLPAPYGDQIPARGEYYDINAPAEEPQEGTE